MITIHSDASVLLIGKNRWLTGAGLYTENYEKSIQLGEGTVNTGEMSGILLACWYGILVGESITVKSDSQFCCNTLNGLFSSKKFPNYLRTFNVLKETYRRMGITLTIVWIPREENKEADRLAKQATAAYKRSVNI